MGNYNPHAPTILGEEWAPIRDEQLVYTPFVNSVERGTTYLQANSGRIERANFYVNKPVAPNVLYHVAQVNLYPAGAEDETGPIRQVIIPVSSVTVTGSNISLGGVAASYTTALARSMDNQYIAFAYNSGNLQSLSAWFAVDRYPELANKRILNVSLVYAGNASDVENVTGRRISFINPSAGSQSMTVVAQYNDLGSGQQFLGKTFSANTGALTDLSSDVNPVTSNPFTNQTFATLNLGDVNNCWDTTNLGGAEKLPWRYADLLRLQETYGAGRQQIQIQVVIPLTTGGVAGAGTSVVMNLDYLALQVTYCEEKRIAYGGQQFSYYTGACGVYLRDLNQAMNPIIPAGLYLPTLTFVNMGQVGFGGTTQGAFPELNAVRELYQIPSHVGTDVDVPFPLSDHLGETFSSTQTHILPQLTLHVSGGSGTLTEPHVYGRQAAAQVYGTNTATQGIYDAISGASATYPQARFYARRFGDTTVPLTLTEVVSSALRVPGAAGSYASTPDAAALDITSDIDLRVEMNMAAWASGLFVTPLSKWNQDGVNQRGYAIQVTDTGLVSIVWSPDGSSALSMTSTSAVPVTTGPLAIRATLDVNNGAAGRTAVFYTAPNIDGPWTQLGNSVTAAGVTSIFSNTSIGQISGHSGSFGADAYPYLVYKAQILNGIDGTVVANPDFTAQAPGTTSFVDSTGKTWSTNGSAAIIGASVTAGANVSITPADFDELAEILDGWREVTLRFGTAPTLGTSGLPAAFRWSATGETAGNRWEIMAASAPSLSNVSSIAPFAQSTYPLGVATYQPPSGTSANLVWMPQGVASQWVTGASVDQATDATLILSQDPATVTGVALTARTQTVTGFGLDCGSLACCIPTGIAYQQVSWSLPINTVLLSDDFTRTAASGLGSADVGGAWTVVAPTAQYAVDGDSAKLTPIAAGTPAIATLSGALDFEASALVGLTAAPASGATGRVSLIGRYSNTSNYYEVYLESTSTGITTLVVQAIVAGVAVASTTSQAVPYTIAAGAMVNLKLMVAATPAGATIKAKAWPQSDTEPPTWLGELNVTGANVLAGTGIGIAARAGTATGIIADFDSFEVGPPSYWFGALELQRFDAEADDFQTIMLATDPGVTSFNDYEARVGITSVYRIRNLNSLNFAGSWSTYVSGAPPEPGVTGGPCGDQTGALIFTSNADQTGANNAAYAMQWSGAPTEDFTLPEADMVVFQPMYRRDGSVAFHGTERGLETFERDVLLHSAAIDPVRLADATTIRDLAWADLPYVCVRDERGDRWLANVRVPTVAARNNATRYMARLKIVETTQAPYPVDPS